MSRIHFLVLYVFRVICMVYCSSQIVEIFFSQIPACSRHGAARPGLAPARACATPRGELGSAPQRRVPAAPAAAAGPAPPPPLLPLAALGRLNNGARLRAGRGAGRSGAGRRSGSGSGSGSAPAPAPAPLRRRSSGPGARRHHAAAPLSLPLPRSDGNPGRDVSPAPWAL